jgi:hypothetical protein
VEFDFVLLLAVPELYSNIGQKVIRISDPDNYGTQDFILNYSNKSKGLGQYSNTGNKKS